MPGKGRRGSPLHRPPPWDPGLAVEPRVCQPGDGAVPFAAPKRRICFMWQ